MQLHEIHPDQFKTFNELPKFSPLSRNYIDFWKTQKQYCIEGIWSNGFWMPGKLYFYVNFGTIKRNVNNAKVKSFGRPLLRDLEWEFFLNWEEARGFSGFELDEFESCSRTLKDFLDEEYDVTDFIKNSYPNIITPKGTFKKYIPARDYLRKWRDKPLGAGLYENNSLNMMMLGSRGFGKDLHKDTLLYYKDHEKPISQVEVGDEIYSPSGKLVTVTNVFKFTDQLQYEVILKDGRKIKCGAGHKWLVYEHLKTDKYVPKVMEVHEMLKKPSVRNARKNRYRYNLPRTKPVEYSHKEFDLDPFTLGQKIRAEKWDRIPNEYFYGDIEQRKALLKGMDNGSNIRYKNKIWSKLMIPGKESILDDIVRIGRSLGYTCSHNGKRVNMIDSPDTVYIPIVDIKPLQVEDSYCISVNDVNSLFLVDGYTPTHNSYSIGVGLVAHEYLFDGKTRYTNTQTSSEVVVGAGDAKYSGETLDKTKVAIEQLPGEITFADRVYPSPFFKRYTGSWSPAKQITNVYEKKIGGQWVTAGTLSNVKHRTFKDNPFAANGTRPGVMVFEEVGFFENLKETYAASVECQRDGATKFGSMIFTGTGGYDSGLSGLASQEMFYNPNDYEMLTFEDYWEHRGKIGYFVPAYLGLNDFKNNAGFTDTISAKQFLEKHRDKLRKSKGGMTALESEIINRPVVPSEIFLEKRGNVFPVMELRARLEKLEQANSYAQLAKKIDLYFDKDAPNGVNYAIDVSNNLQAIDNFPWKSKDREGCVVIYEFPAYVDDKIPQGAYIIGHDPYATDDESGESLAATVVLKTKKAFNSIGHDEIVAVYYGRPYQGRHIVNENLYKLSLFYGGAKIYFENVRGNVKEYFEKIKRLDLLAKQPTTVLNKKASFTQSNVVIYGYPMSSQQMKIEAMHYIRDWLLEEREVITHGNETTTVRNLDYIWDRKLLQELIMFNMDGNFDAVMSLAGAIIGLQETHNQYHNTLIQTSQPDIIKTDIERFIVNNKSLFKNTNYAL